MGPTETRCRFASARCLVELLVELALRLHGLRLLLVAESLVRGFLISLVQKLLEKCSTSVDGLDIGAVMDSRGYFVRSLIDSKFWSGSGQAADTTQRTGLHENWNMSFY